jgi:hypothetical protein
MSLRARADEGPSAASGQVSAKFVEHLRWALSFQNRLVRARACLFHRNGEAEVREVKRVFPTLRVQ